MIDILKGRTERLSLKEVPFKCHTPATDEEIDSFIERTAELDDELPSKKRDNKLQKLQVTSCKDYQSFLKDHCQEGHYAFQIKKCDDITCCESQEKGEWLPYPVPGP